MHCSLKSDQLSKMFYINFFILEQPFISRKISRQYIQFPYTSLSLMQIPPTVVILMQNGAFSLPFTYRKNDYYPVFEMYMGTTLFSIYLGKIVMATQR